MKTLINKLTFPQLPYAFDALEPHIDAMTMEIHYTRHHRAYFDNLMAAVKDTEMAGMNFDELLQNISKYPTAVRNNGGGHFNHSLFWKVMSPRGGGKPAGDLAAAINKKFGSFEKMQELFNNAAKTRFGSGWAWLSVKADKSLCVCSSPNQDNPLMDVSECKGTPILGLDVWEHAYYLKYQNKRPDYISAFWNVINWAEVEANYKAAL
jgi:superoxide dismutase, Fe-Mn family